MSRTRSATATLSLAALFAACASAGGGAPPEAAGAPAAAPPAPEVETPLPAGAPDPLEPSPEARRAAESVELTGLEMGTMWTFENPPLDHWSESYDFRPTEEWLEHVRLSSVRYGEICSASFVSPEGLVMTNHHCARDCAEAVSDETNDYVETGFYAASRAEEPLCPELFLDQLVSISDVTERVRGAAPAGADEARIAEAQETEREAIAEECEAGSERSCEVVSLYHGGQYQLYEYRRYAPVKLVFLPELQAGFFGGDPDNFTYPRYVLDVAFVRAYQPDSATAASTPHHFEWDADGAQEEELVLITGNPGSTDRLATVSQVLYERAYRHPFIVQFLEGQRDILAFIASFGPEAERAVRDQMFSVENSLKAYRGQLGGLGDSLLVARKIRWEEEFQARLARDPAAQQEYGDVWQRLASLQREKLRLSPRINANDPQFGGNPVTVTAGTLVRYLRQIALPEAQRDSAFAGEALGATESRLRGPLGVNPEIARRLLALRLAIADRWLPPDDPFRAAALEPGETPEEAARRILADTRLLDPAARGELMDAGAAALEGADDPLLSLAGTMVETYDRLEPEWETVQASESVQEERLARALFAAFGTDLPPDATFTLRISDGVVRRYPYNGTFAPPRTSIGGMYERAANFGDEMPWTLPRAFAERRNEVQMDAPLNFVTTNDITGGNSGSPMIDREGRVVGLAFDGNIEQLPNEFLFRTAAGRTIGVHAAGITEALRSVYGADALLAELLGDDR